jgi:hypothetical protein
LILYVSLNQCHIRVDASGCKILYINVTNWEFQLPAFWKTINEMVPIQCKHLSTLGAMMKWVQILSLICVDGKANICWQFILQV